MRKSLIFVMAFSFLLFSATSSSADLISGSSLEAEIVKIGGGTLFGNPTHYVATQFTSPKIFTLPSITFTGRLATAYQASQLQSDIEYAFADAVLDVRATGFTFNIIPDDNLFTDWSWLLVLDDLSWSVPNEKITGLSVISDTIGIYETGMGTNGALYVDFYTEEPLGAGPGGTAVFEFVTGPAEVPVPAALYLLFTGLLGIIGLRRKSR